MTITGWVRTAAVIASLAEDRTISVGQEDRRSDEGRSSREPWLESERLIA